MLQFLQTTFDIANMILVIVYESEILVKKKIIAPKEKIQTVNQPAAQTYFVNSGFTPTFVQPGTSGINYQTNQGSGIY